MSARFESTGTGVDARLEVRDLAVAIGGRQVVEGVSFDLAPGEVVALVGRSGSGKSLTARALVGLPPPGATVDGSVRLEGRELLTLGERGLRSVRGPEIGLILQEPATALDPVMPIGALAAEGLRVHGLARGRAAGREAQTWLERVGLDPAVVPSVRRPHQLSGGQRQRAALATAMALRPLVLIADEPTTALDPITAAQVIDLLAQTTRASGAALLLISHDLALVARTADRILALDGGRLVAAGPTLQALEGRTPAILALREAAGSRPPSSEATAGAAPVLQAAGLTRRYGTGGVEGVGLSLRPGERLAVVGETGAGKSTLLRLLLGLERPDAGDVRLAGEAFNPATPATQRRLRRRIQPVFQDPAGSFDPRWTAGRIVAEPLRLLSLDALETRARVADALQAVGLSGEDADRPARSFSGGQRQRLALARALSVGPDVLVLDEATSALDPVSRAEILELIARLGRERGMACLAVTHDLALVRVFADRVLVLRDGRAVEDGPAAGLLHAPADPYTRALFAAAPDLEAVIAERGRAERRARGGQG